MTGEKPVAHVLHNALFLLHDQSPRWAGSVNAKVAPTSLLLEAPMVPPWALRIVRLMESPSLPPTIS